MKVKFEVEVQVGNPFSLRKLLGIHDYVWEGEDEQEESD